MNFSTGVLRGNNEKMRAEVVRICKEHYGVEHKPEDIADCDGCKAEEGRLFSGCK